MGLNLASEAALCSELSIGFANIASVDNYGNGIGGESPTFEAVKASARKNAENIRDILKAAITALL